MLLIASLPPLPLRLKLPHWNSRAFAAALDQDWSVRQADHVASQSSGWGTAFSNNSASLSLPSANGSNAPAAELGLRKTFNDRRCSSLLACSCIRHACKCPRISYLDHLVDSRCFFGCVLHRPPNSIRPWLHTRQPNAQVPPRCDGLACNQERCCGTPSASRRLPQVFFHVVSNLYQTQREQSPAKSRCRRRCAEGGSSTEPNISIISLASCSFLFSSHEGLDSPCLRLLLWLAFEPALVPAAVLGGLAAEAPAARLGATTGGNGRRPAMDRCLVTALKQRCTNFAIARKHLQ